VTVLQWAPVVGASVALVSMVVAAIWWVGKKTIEAKVLTVEADGKAETARLKADLNQQLYEAHQRAVSAESRAREAEAVASATRRELISQILEELHSKTASEASVLTSGGLLRLQIENDLRGVMQDLGATESSVIVRDPEPQSNSFVFLVAHGPAASQIEKMKVPPHSIAGAVYRSGTPAIGDPRENPDFSPSVDSRAEHVTRNMLTVPLYHGQGIVGVAQFLNKENGQDFGPSDAYAATSAVTRVSVKVGDFVRNVDHFSQVGLYSPPSPYQAAIVFCDLSHSALLFDVLGEAGAVACINEYLSRVTEIVLDAGGAIDGYLGDGAMFRFVDDLPAVAEPGNLTVHNAVTTALRAAEDFGRIKQAWLKRDWQVERVHSRLSISYGPYREVRLGPVRHRENSVVGASVHKAAQICELASRDRTLVVVDRTVASLVQDVWRLDDAVAAGLPETFYEVKPVA
jgi:class 3 adenylate cyclase